MRLSESLMASMSWFLLMMMIISIYKLLNNGQVLAGMIAEESPSSLTLKQAENRQEVILRENVAEIKATGVSLMPEGLEKKVTPAEMADLLAFLRGD